MLIFGEFEVGIEPGGPFHPLIIGIFGLRGKRETTRIGVPEARTKPLVFTERLRAGSAKILSCGVTEKIPAVNVVYIAVFIIVAAVVGTFARIRPDEFRKSGMRNVQAAVDDGDDDVRLFPGGGNSYPSLHESLSDELPIANRRRTKTRGHPFVRMTAVPKTGKRQKIIL